MGILWTVTQAHGWTLGFSVWSLFLWSFPVKHVLTSPPPLPHYHLHYITCINTSLKKWLLLQMWTCCALVVTSSYLSHCCLSMMTNQSAHCPRTPKEELVMSCNGYVWKLQVMLTPAAIWHEPLWRVQSHFSSFSSTYWFCKPMKPWQK